MVHIHSGVERAGGGAVGSGRSDHAADWTEPAPAAGAPVRSHFGGEAYWGEVTEVRPLPSPAQPDGSTALWHVRYEDGDEEELNMWEERLAELQAMHDSAGWQNQG